MKMPYACSVDLRLEQWPLKRPFAISGRTFSCVDTVLVTLTCKGIRGRGEAAGVFYTADQPASIFRQIEALTTEVEAGLTRAMLQKLLPPGGARNALDCALWDLEARLTGRPAWELAGLSTMAPVVTTFGCSADIPETVASTALAYVDARAIKLKLAGDGLDRDRVRAVREVRPDVWLSVDANQGFTPESLEALLPTLVAADVKLIEQPLPVSDDALLEGIQAPIPIAADESVQTLADLARMVGRFDVVNIKLDKCGGLTAALAMAHRARELGLGLMVGNMFGTSLAMAPACLLGQLCDVCDLDGPIFFSADRADRALYRDGTIIPPASLWGMSGHV